MSRLTIRSGMFDENGNRIQDLEGYHTSSSDANRFAKKEIYKLGQLEDVLEEFEIESAEELRCMLKFGQREFEKCKCELVRDYIEGSLLFDNYNDIFGDKSEAEQKLKELGEKK